MLNLKRGGKNRKNSHTQSKTKKSKKKGHIQTTINISAEHHTNNYPIIFDLFYKYKKNHRFCNIIKFK